jgi:hypothetical protein
MSPSAVVAKAAAAMDSCTNPELVVVMVLLVRLAVGSAITLPPERIRSPRELALEKRRGRAMSKSAGDGKNEVALADAPGVSIVGGCGYPRIGRQADIRSVD